ncbi:flagellar basal body rod C-terminal domain-containing protein [Jeotgalibaca caeni]|uniref:flagellar basal body rod C-terminal domain-containing protein n=1 Tax=Jeotgalibaca caeni TaxID=3028623 RepID=UPI00237DF172|nr:flagellar basal body rod C-terminal domain-containing protein [Jeotgalibaca caeni]MDE1548265.1 flagellar basal body rod C-terminal domain-containing protein [Jeotgalibaca caeni]
MIRSMDTLQHNFRILQKKQEMVAGNFANINTPGYQAQKMVQRAGEERAMVNHLGGPDRNLQTDVGGFTFQNYIDEVYVDETPGAIKEDPTNPGSYIEMSNVNTADEMVEMMKISREFEANQKALHASDETLRKASNEIGKV